MRHLKVINHLGRTSSHRKSMLANMATSLILHKRITTTTAKAKALKTYVEPLITKSKKDSTHSRRVAFSYLKDKAAVSELFREISPKVGERPGGYTRILKTGNRIGDNAEMCILELVDYNELMLGGGEAAKTKTARRRRSPKKKAAAEGTAKTVKAVAEKTEEPVSEAEETTEETQSEEEK
jgi:large subunit ribosomal protein L17